MGRNRINICCQSHLAIERCTEHLKDLHLKKVYFTEKLRLMSVQYVNLFYLVNLFLEFDNTGHPVRQTYIPIKRSVHWLLVKHDVKAWVQRCGRCLRRKSLANLQAPLVNITTTHPLGRVCLDYLTLETSKGGILTF